MYSVHSVRSTGSFRQPRRIKPAWLFCILAASVIIVTVATIATNFPTATYTATLLQATVPQDIVVGGSQPAPASTTGGPNTTAKTSARSPAMDASAALSRISQLDCAQYASSSECSAWAYSACSAAAMTEVIDSYGFHYRITDILRQEVAAGAITPAQGLLDDQGIERTVARFGFTTDWGYHRSLDQIIQVANQGTPVIVAWPPAKYPGGHLVVVVGGTATMVRIADSSRYDRTTIARAQFLDWWAGYSAIIHPGPYTMVGKPSLSVAFMNEVLAAYHSPATGLAQALYNDGVKYSIDPAYALAFFLHESSFGTSGVARTTKSLGNSRCTQVEDYCYQYNGGYAGYDSWQAGFAGWYWQMEQYLSGALTGSPLVTLDQILPVYAPSSDHNDVAEYIASLKDALQTWWSGQVIVR